jgi:hypothetical protein
MKCSTCIHWQTDTPEAVYRADCALDMLTKPEEWQCCSKWKDRSPDAGPHETTNKAGAVVNYWGHYWGKP